MKKRLISAVALGLFCGGAAVIVPILLFVNVAYAGSASLTELVNDKGVWDRQEVIVSGEAIGDRMERGGYAWVNILDQGAAVGVWGEKDLLRKISLLGDYDRVGDRVQVKGEFHLSCPEHGGDTDIHAREVKIVKSGYEVKHQVSPERMALAGALLALAAALGIIVYHRAHREGRS